MIKSKNYIYILKLIDELGKVLNKYNYDWQENLFNNNVFIEMKKVYIN